MYVVEDWCRVTECRLVGQGYDCMEGSVVGDGKDGISILLEYRPGDWSEWRLFWGRMDRLQQDAGERQHSTQQQRRLNVLTTR